MNRYKLTLLLGALMVMLTQCADEELGPVVTFESAKKGAYIRFVSDDPNTSTLINILNDQTIADSRYTYSVEFVDLEQGATVAEYRLDLVYDPITGDPQTFSNFRVFTSSEFVDRESGFKGLEDITITAAEVIAGANLTNADLEAGDQFTLQGFVTTQDGSEFGAANSSAAVRGNAFQGFFNIVMPASCPSDLAGTYPYTQSASFCGDLSDGEVEFIDQGSGFYTMSDWSLGSYDACYGGFTPAGWGELQFSEVCADVNFTGFVDNYGDSWTFTSTLTQGETDWTIQWQNTYGESGTSTIVNSEGWSFKVD